MGQKSSRFLFTVGSNFDWHSKWFAKTSDKYALYVYEDIMIRNYFQEFEKKLLISHINVNRLGENIDVIINTCRPGSIIGKPDQMDNFKKEIKSIIGKNVSISVMAVKKPDFNAKIVAMSISSQIESRMSYKKAVRFAMENVTRLGAKGIKICISGRLNGAEIARSESFKVGSIPLHTIRSDISYSYVKAVTTYGVIGVKVWVNRPIDLSNLRI